MWSVAIACNTDGSVHWTATVRNQAACTVYDAWSAQLQVKLSGGSQFVNVQTTHGSSSFAPGNTVLSGDIGYSFPPDARVIRVEFVPLADGVRCNPHARSDGIAPCR